MAYKTAAQADQSVTSHEEVAAPAPNKRIKLRNTKRANGQIGGIAKPLAKDVDVWLAKGWVRD